MSQLTIDDCASYTHVDCYILCAHDWLLAEGDQPNSKSGKKAAGHNTDGFDVGSHDLTIKDSVILNQDDCLGTYSTGRIE